MSTTTTIDPLNDYDQTKGPQRVPVRRVDISERLAEWQGHPTERVAVGLGLLAADAKPSSRIDELCRRFMVDQRMQQLTGGTAPTQANNLLADVVEFDISKPTKAQRTKARADGIQAALDGTPRYQNPETQRELRDEWFGGFDEQITSFEMGGGWERFQN